MSMKDQRTLVYSAVIIIALTVVGVIALNFIVEKISQIKPPAVTLGQPVRESSDDIVKQPKPFARDKASKIELKDKKQVPRLDDRFQRPGSLGKPPMPPPDVQRRLRGGQNAPDMRMPPKGMPQGFNNGFPGSYPPRPPRGNEPTFNPMMPPSMPQNGMRMSPGEREQMEREMEQRREQFFNSPYPPPNYPREFYPPPGYDGYEPPPPPPFHYPPGFNGDDYDYDYGPPTESHFDPTKFNQENLVQLSDLRERMEEIEPDYGHEDDYFDDADVD